MTRKGRAVGAVLAFALVLGAVVFNWAQQSVDPHLFWADPSRLGHLPWYAGVLSNAGVVVWFAGSAIALFAASLVPRGKHGPPSRERLCLLCFGVFLGLLGLDDMALLHEQVFPESLGVPQLAVMGAYAVGALVLLSAFNEQLLAQRPSLVLFGGVCLAFSAGVDVLHLAPGGRGTVIEDGLKLLGAMSWTLAAIDRSHESLEADKALTGGAGAADEGRAADRRRSPQP